MAVTDALSLFDIIAIAAFGVSIVALGVSFVSLYQTFFNRTPKAMVWASNPATVLYISEDPERENEEAWEVMVGNIGRVPIFLTELHLSSKGKLTVNDESLGYMHMSENKNKIEVSMIPVNEVRQFQVVVALDEDRLSEDAMSKDVIPDHRKSKLHYAARIRLPKQAFQRIAIMNQPLCQIFAN